MHDNGCLVNDIAKAHGGKQMIQTPNGVKLPLVIKNGLPYLEHQYPTDKQMKDDTMREEWMTSKGTWDPSKLDDLPGASDCSISQFSPIPQDAIDSFYTTQGDIRATKSDLKNEPVDSNSTKDPVVDDSTKDPVATDSAKEPAARDSLKDPVVSD